MVEQQSDVWVSSDWHLRHENIAKHRGFSSIEEHDDTVINNINKVVSKRSKLFVLGDIAINKKALPILKRINCKNLELIFGNHDQANIYEYLKYFTKVHGFRSYKNFFLSHAPIHPQELYRCRGSIHGHIHSNSKSKPLPLPYFNVNVDAEGVDFKPVNFTTILNAFEEFENERD